MYQRILVAHDGSPFAEQVLPHAVEIARRFGAEIHLLEVIPPPNPALYAVDLDAGAGVDLAAQAIDEAQEELRSQGRARLEAVAHQIGQQGVKAAWSIVDGDPAREIITYADANAVDLIAMASHGRSGLARALVGSVTDAVLRHGGHPLLVIKAEE